jgi:hypothetical protein
MECPGINQTSFGLWVECAVTTPMRPKAISPLILFLLTTCLTQAVLCTETSISISRKWLDCRTGTEQAMQYSCSTVLQWKQTVFKLCFFNSAAVLVLRYFNGSRLCLNFGFYTTAAALPQCASLPTQWQSSTDNSPFKARKDRCSTIDENSLPCEGRNCQELNPSPTWFDQLNN